MVIAARRDPLMGLNKLQAKMGVAAGNSQHLNSSTLFAGGSEVVIAHGAELYRLRLTRQNRLILTK